MSPVTAHTHKRLNICYLSYASTLDFVTKTHSFRDKIASGQRSKIPSRTSIMANYIHLKDLGFSKEKAETRNEKLIST